MFVNPALISVAAANDSGFSGRAPSEDPAPLNQLTFLSEAFQSICSGPSARVFSAARSPGAVGR